MSSKLVIFLSDYTTNIKFWTTKKFISYSLPEEMIM